MLDRVELVALDDSVAAGAAALLPLELRSLDAIQLTTALSLRDVVDAFVAYDARLLRAASAAGLPVASPGC